MAGSVTTHVRAALGFQCSIPGVWLFSHQTIRALAAKLSIIEGKVARPALLLKAAANQAADANRPLTFQQVRHSS